nr:PREDICTED: diacylglycerol kinase theta [Apteryx mantelli mantelli]
MSHEKCLKNVKIPCSCIAPSLVRVPVAHCFGPPGHYKRKFCTVCRKSLDSPAFRCEVCELHVHTDCILFACSDCRQCHQDGHQDHDTYHHHWREGNLSSSARCEVCKKTCGSSEVLSGMRCEWCGILAHAACYIIVTPECTFGRLRNMILPPSCVQLYSRNFSKLHCFRISENLQTEPAQIILAKIERGVMNTFSVPFYGSAKDVQISTDSSKQTLKIFDGNDAVKRNQFRLISVPRIAKNEEVVEAALRAYYINDDQQEYELQTFTQQALLSDDVINRNDALEDSNMGSVFRESVPDAWIIRAKPKDEEVIRIYPAWLKVGMAYISLRVNKDSTTQTVIKDVLPLLGRQTESIQSFKLVEVLMGSKQVQRMVLDNQELILNRLKDIRKTSIRQMNQTRFYIVENSKSIVRVNLFVGGLPPQLSAEEYTNILKDELAIKTNVVSLTHVYQAQGAVVLEISCFSEAERIYMLVKDTTVNDKPLNSVVIPDCQSSKIPQNCCPLLVFVNPKSGGLKGRDLLYSLFHTFSKIPSFRVLVCGGDGTVGWVLGALEEIRHKLVCSEPSVAILPLGTGNDLGRVLRWGAGYSGEDPYSILISVDEADDVLMDRWTILLDAEEPAEGAENGVAEPEPPKIVQMNNYCGLGIDAELSLDFHHAREEEPGKFNSRFHNKGVYVKVGLQKISHTRNLHKDIKLQVDQHEVELPSIEGLIFINIPSWGSGADLWGSDSDNRFEKPRIDDGLLEVVGVTGVVHMGQVQGGLRSGIRIAQGSYFRVTLLKPIPVQVDGEPWIQAPGQIIISAAGPKVHMLKKSKLGIEQTCWSCRTLHVSAVRGHGRGGPYSLLSQSHLTVVIEWLDPSLQINMINKVALSPRKETSCFEEPNATSAPNTFRLPLCLRGPADRWSACNAVPRLDQEGMWWLLRQEILQGLAARLRGHNDAPHTALPTLPGTEQARKPSCFLVLQSGHNMQQPAQQQIQSRQLPRSHSKRKCVQQEQGQPGNTRRKRMPAAAPNWGLDIPKHLPLRPQPDCPGTKSRHRRSIKLAPCSVLFTALPACKRHSTRRSLQSEPALQPSPGPGEDYQHNRSYRTLGAATMRPRRAHSPHQHPMTPGSPNNYPATHSFPDGFAQSARQNRRQQAKHSRWLRQHPKRQRVALLLPTHLPTFKDYFRKSNSPDSHIPKRTADMPRISRLPLQSTQPKCSEHVHSLTLLEGNRTRHAAAPKHTLSSTPFC